MTMKYRGILDELKDLLDRHDILGSWERRPNGVFIMRAPAGANLHWASGSKSVWVDGKPAARDQLTLNVAAILHHV